MIRNYSHKKYHQRITTTKIRQLIDSTITPLHLKSRQIAVPKKLRQIPTTAPNADVGAVGAVGAVSG